MAPAVAYFNSLKVRLKDQGGGHYDGELFQFQFLKGAIKRRYSNYDDAPLDSGFNSLKVRLKVSRAWYGSATHICFNSLKVRLKVVETPAVLAYHEFVSIP